jgi:beta-ribofuranosylaminobenzene 5'-phosphate synthase
MIITARSRIHVSLADMAFASPRGFGGVGFAIRDPCTCVRISPATQIQIDGIDKLDARSKFALSELVERMVLRANKTGCKIELLNSPPQHVGFGSQTSLSLAVAAGINAIYDIGLQQDELQLLSGRGGGSGVGIHAFFHGGVIWDAGRAREEIVAYQPSGAGAPITLPPLMLRIHFPTTWSVVLALPDCLTISGASEKEFFQNNTPIPELESLRTMAELYHGVLPAFHNSDYRALARSLKTIHGFGFKSREFRRLPESIQEAVQCLQSRGLAAGISSLGPLIYILQEDTNSITELVEQCLRPLSLKSLSRVLGCDSGHDVSP